MANLRKKAGADGGFTLIELMIVIAIIAILAAIAIPNFMSARDRAKRSSAKQSLGAIRKAMEMYLTDKDTYPKELDSGADVTGAVVAGSIGGYTNITSLMAAFRDSSAAGGALSCTGSNCKAAFVIDIAAPGVGYTITARCRDRGDSPAYATGGDIAENVWTVPD